MSSSFGISRDGEFLTIKFPKQVDLQESKELSDSVSGWTEEFTRLALLDLSETVSLHSGAFRTIAALQQKLKKEGGHLASLRPVHLISAIQSMGMQSIFSPVGSVDEARKLAGLSPAARAETGPTKLGLDVKFINPFIKAAMTTFETQAKLKIQVEKPCLKTSPDTYDPPIEIAGVLNLSSKAFHGSISLCFPREVFLKIYQNMLGVKPAEITRECEDAAGELLNVIFGMAKAELNDTTDYQIERAIPKVIRGPSLTMDTPSATLTVMSLPLVSDLGRLFLEIALKPANSLL